MRKIFLLVLMIGFMTACGQEELPVERWVCPANPGLVSKILPERAEYIVEDEYWRAQLDDVISRKADYKNSPERWVVHATCYKITDRSWLKE